MNNEQILNEENYQYSDFGGDLHALDIQELCPICKGKLILMPDNRTGQVVACPKDNYYHQYEG